jgi:hypothetical protein
MENRMGIRMKSPYRHHPRSKLIRGCDGETLRGKSQKHCA